MTTFIDDQRTEFGVEPICRELQIAPQTYYAAKSRPPSARAMRDAEMKPKVLDAWMANRRVYGAHKLWKQLRRQGDAIGRDQVGRLMRDLGIEGVRRGKKRRTTIADPTAAALRTSSTGTSPPPDRISCGSPISPTSPRGRAWPTRPSSSTSTPG